MKHTYTQTHPAISARKGPCIASWSILAAHNKEEFILRVVRSIHIIFGTIAIAMKSIIHACAHPYMSRKATGIDGHRGTEIDSFAYMVLRGYTHNAIVSQDCSFSCMSNA